MKLGKVVLVFLLLLIGAGVIGGGCAVSGYNKAVRLSENVKQSWAQVENQLQRRFDLIPNAVEAVKGYAKHEKELFENIAKARAAYTQPGATLSDKAKAATQMEGFLSRLLVIQEQYPQLKANESFLKLQDELSGTENRLSVERKRYNDSVRDLNGYCRSFFGRMFAGWAQVSEAEYFEAEKTAKEAPKVKF